MKRTPGAVRLLAGMCICAGAIAWSPARQGPGTLVDPRDGKTYRTVTIGTQTWMAENLAFKACNGGCWPYENKASNATVYGYLYTWDVARKACPSAWHLPADAEWSKLVESLGGESAAGGKLKEAGAAHWATPNTGATNESGFSALPGGGRSYDGKFDTIGRDGAWWSSTEDDAMSAWYRGLYNRISDAKRFRSIKANGYAVRCVKD